MYILLYYIVQLAVKVSYGFFQTAFALHLRAGLWIPTRAP